MKCAKPWQSGHSCDGKGIRERVFNRLRSGDHHTHVNSELIATVESNHEYTGDIHLGDTDP